MIYDTLENQKKSNILLSADKFTFCDYMLKSVGNSKTIV